MKLFRKLFAEKILRYYEGTEAGIKMIKSFPVIRKLVKDDAFGEKSKSRAIVGTMAQIFMLAWEFMKSLVIAGVPPWQGFGFCSAKKTKKSCIHGVDKALP